MPKPDSCFYCNKKPRIVDMSDLFYVQCDCGKWNPYEFCGSTRNNAISQWNYTQSDGRRYKKKIKTGGQLCGYM